MIKKAALQPERLMGWMESLADPTRLRLLRLLEQQELGVTELCDVLQMPQSTISRHLKLLSNQGWMHCRRQGTTNFYRTHVGELDPSARRLWSLARDQINEWAAVNQDQLRLAERLQTRQKASQEFFAGAVNQWDKLRVQLYGDCLTGTALTALLPSEWVVADLGCGTGRVAAELAGYVKGVIGVDQSEQMLKAARKHTSALNNVELRRGPLEAVPMDDASCDAALLLLVLTYVSQPAVVLSEVARVLRPGGKVVIVDLLRHSREDFRLQMGQQCMGYDPQELERLLTDVGLAQPQSRLLPPQPRVKGPALLLATATRQSRAGSPRRGAPQSKR